MSITPKAIIYESQYCQVVLPSKPHITKTDGGHLVIMPKSKKEFRQEWTKEEAIDVIKLTMIVGQAMNDVLREQGIELARINYQDNGNWALVHPDKKSVAKIHLYGRAINSKHQSHGCSLDFPPGGDEFYDTTEPFSDNDMIRLKEKIEKLLKSAKYQNW